jgi:hypothetical protein
MSRPPAPEPPYRFFLALGLVLVFAAALWLGLIYGPSRYAAIEHLRQVRYHDGTFYYLPIKLTAAGYLQAKLALLGLLGLSGGVLLGQWRGRGRWWQELRRLGQEWRTAPPLLQPWRRLRPAERATALGLFGLLLLVRGYYVLHYPLYGDEVVSYYCFVRQGAVAVTSFYPIPNNHIGYSALCWLLSQLSDHFYWTMRAPTFLLSGLGTALVGLLLLRHVSFRVAALTVLLFGFFPYSLLQSVIGRGYFLLAVSGQLSFVAALALLRGTPRRRLAWALLLASSVLGLYAMPTYLLLFASLCGALGLMYVAQRQPAALGRLVLAGLLTALPTVLLYAPVLLVSGPGALFSNDYVAPRASLTLLDSLQFARRIEGQLLGYEPLGLWPTLALSLLWLGLLGGWRAARRLYFLVLPALVALWLPYLLLAARHMFPPPRVLSYRLFFLLLLGALLLELLLRWRPLRRLPLLLTVVLPVLLWAGAGLVPFQRRAAFEAQRNARVAETYRWLRGQGAHHVLSNHGHYQVYLPYYAELGHWPLRLDAAPAPGVRYEFELLDKSGKTPPPAGAAPLLENADVRVFRRRPQ